MVSPSQFNWKLFVPRTKTRQSFLSQSWVCYQRYSREHGDENVDEDYVSEEEIESIE